MSRPMLCSSTGKKVFFSAESIKHSIKLSDVKCIAYKCRDCGFLHMSKKRGRKARDQVKV